ncbi:hypothetical protein KFK09_012614 [Dendrobium nobile]|uniref:Transcription factor Pur-alpha 1 n=1 Tax=Dendrobium nobile TaxID=94219 RepID=A0A8T3BI80_DENNO|nr:hypothetical protein KFK09_012614 [Dendrobium nobile]
MEGTASGSDVELMSKTLQFEHKLFYFDLKENPRGRYLKISEKTSATRSTIIVPVNGIVWFLDLFNYYVNTDERDAFSKELKLDTKQHLESSERVPGLSDDVGAGFISGSGHSIQPVTGSDLNVDRLVELSPQDEVGSMGLSKVIRADQKRFFFDLGSNNRGHFLRISEVAGPDRSSIILPLSALKQFHEMLGHFVEITKDRLEGISNANVRTVEPSQR